MTINWRPNNTGQPHLDGRTCYGCDAAAVLNIHIVHGMYVHELRLCNACRVELRNALVGHRAPPPPGTRKGEEPR